MGAPAHHRSPQPHERQRARSRQAARHRSGHFVSQDRTISHRTMTRRQLQVTLSLLIAAASATVSRAENWDRFRGPNGAGQSDALGIPTEWNEKNFLWH